MDEKSKKLLGTATVAIASLGLASLPGDAAPPGQPLAPLGNYAPNSLNSASDPLLELTLRTGGSLTPEALKRELRLMLSYITPERMAQMPALVRGLRSLGLSRDAEEDIVATLVELLAETELSVSDEQIEQLASALAAEPERASLARSGPPGQDRETDQGGGRGVGLYGG